MIIVYFKTPSGIQSKELTNENNLLLQKALWVDLVNPTTLEEESLEKYFEIDIPTKSDAEEIEPSSRIYVKNSVLFMTATMVALADSPEAKTDIVTFILRGKVLITVRYIELHAFNLFASQLLKYKKESTATGLMIGLFDAAIDRLADILEKISHNFDGTSKFIFHQKENKHSAKNISYKKILQNIGTNGDLGTKAQESLISFSRLISFLQQSEDLKLSTNASASLIILSKDLGALSDYATFLSTKFNFLLDATLGMISIEQNNIIKIFTVAAVVFLPPTLIASIYGMNFHHMPELKWYIGYPSSLLLMVFSALLPFGYFKRKKWI